MLCNRSDAVFASAFRAKDGHHGIAILTEQGAVVSQYKLPARGHDVVFRPKSHQIIAFARRPGTFAAIIDRATKITNLISAPVDRHFYGHGCFSADGKLLFSTENDFDNERGVVGIYKADAGFERIGELDSFGIGPHELLLLPDRRTLVVANGGIVTHPDFPRAKLNVATMKPNLSFIDLQSGRLIEQIELGEELHKLSIRHLAILGDQIWFACQNEGDVSELKPLIGRVSMRHGDHTLFDLPEEQASQLRGYVGSIAANKLNNRVAFTSPRGGVAMEIDATTGEVISTSKQLDVCGIATQGDGFLTTSGNGNFAGFSGDLLWDNHITSKKRAGGDSVI